MNERARQTQTRVRIATAAAFMCLCILVTAFGAHETTSIIPLPVECEWRDGSFVIASSTRIAATGVAAVEASKLMDVLAPAMGYRLERVDDPPANGNTVQMRIESSLQDRLGEEGYDVDVTPRAIVIRAAGPAGLFYGVQTLRQLLPPAVFSRQRIDGVEWAVPCVHIVDYPRFKWRGLLIDPARHFIPVPDVERYIDAMALHKFNRLQIHLTDDQGWRIEIRKYPAWWRSGRGWTSPRRPDARNEAKGWPAARRVLYAGSDSPVGSLRCGSPCHDGAGDRDARSHGRCNRVIPAPRLVSGEAQRT